MCTLYYHFLAVIRLMATSIEQVIMVALVNELTAKVVKQLFIMGFGLVKQLLTMGRVNQLRESMGLVK